MKRPLDTPRRFFLGASPLRALAESCLVALALFVTLYLQVDRLAPAVLGNGLLFLCGASGLWAVLRTRLPQGSWQRQARVELVNGLYLSLAVTSIIRTSAALFGWEAVWTKSNWGTAFMVTLLLLGIGVGYLPARVLLRLGLLWDRLRRRHMVWALTHAQLTVVAVVILLAVAVWLVFSPFTAGGAPSQPDAGLLATVTERLLHTVFPAVSIVGILSAVALSMLLVPAALFSFLVARKTTRRLYALVAAARDLRAGHYAARVAIVGEDEVAQLQGDFNAMAAELERTLRDLQIERDKVAALLQSQRELVAGVSHELRTPVATMRGYLEAARANLDAAAPADPSTGPVGHACSVTSDSIPPLATSGNAEQLRHDLEIVENETVRLQGLIDDLFTLARAEAGGLPLEIGPLDVGAVIRQRIEALAPLAWQAGRVEMSADLPAELPAALADERRLEQVLVNLLRNAASHTLPGGIVVAAAVTEERAIRIEVRDTGEGIAPEDLPHIWTRFYQSGSRREPGSAGLGLALVKELTEAMGGTVAVESEVGKGSCFTLRLPRA